MSKEIQDLIELRDSIERYKSFFKSREEEKELEKKRFCEENKDFYEIAFEEAEFFHKGSFDDNGGFISHKTNFKINNAVYCIHNDDKDHLPSKPHAHLYTDGRNDIKINLKDGSYWLKNKPIELEGKEKMKKKNFIQLLKQIDKKATDKIKQDVLKLHNCKDFSSLIKKFE